MKIPIKGGDNDFGNRFIPVLNTLKYAFEDVGKLPEDKDKICFIINKLSPVMYLLFQNQYRYNGLEDVEQGLHTGRSAEYIHTEKYLQIFPDQILLNEEVDVYLKTTDDDNSGTILFDSNTGYVWTI